MAISSVSSTPVTPPAQTRAAGAASSLQQAAAVLTDGSGQYSDADKLAAYNLITANWASIGSTDSATQAAVNNAFDTSPFVQNLQNVQNSFIQSLSAAATSAPTSSAGFHAQIAAYKALSPTDQQLVTPVFQGLTGNQWVGLTRARAGLANILDQASASGQLTGGGANFETNNATVRQALTLTNQFQAGQVLSADQQLAWTQQANTFLNQSSSSPAVVVTLSNDAQAYLRDQTGQTQSTLQKSGGA
jgi:hypothetical protein